MARNAGKLVQLAVDGVAPPLPFNQIQCADLADWTGDTNALGWRKVAASVAELATGHDLDLGLRAATRARKLSICVLPFANMSGDAEQEYFSDGISEDIITDLSKVSALSVVARNTAFTFKGKHVDVRQLARQLEVEHVLEGSVRKAGGRVRITAQLIDGETGNHAWAERYDRDLSDIFALQDEISQAIVAALKLRLLPEEKQAIERRGTSSPEAYNLFLMARSWPAGTMWPAPKPTRAAMGRSLCREAVRVDENYAAAWALLALAQTLLFFADEGEDDGLAAAERALTLDPNLSGPGTWPNTAGRTKPSPRSNLPFVWRPSHSRSIPPPPP